MCEHGGFSQSQSQMDFELNKFTLYHIRIRTCAIIKFLPLLHTSFDPLQLPSL